MNKRVYQRGVHTFFEDLSTFLCNTASLGIAINAIMSRGVGGFASDSSHYFEFEGCKIRKRFVWYPHASLSLVAEGKWPDEIELFEDVSVHKPGGPRIDSIRGIVSTSLGAAFVRYYESEKEEIKRRYGASTQQWPSELNFARVIRNAFAHGGMIYFADQTAPPVEWRGIRYSPIDNGRSIVFQDIALVEPILLMEEIDRLVR